MSRLKLYAHTLLPEPAVSWLRAARRRVYRPDPSMRAAYSRFAELNQSRQPGSITMREGIHFLTHSESFQSFQWFCWRSPDMVAEYDRFVTDCPAKSTFLDIGACHGVYSLTYLSINPRGRAIAVEPSPIAREILEHNLAKNHLSDRYRIIPAAAGENGGAMYAVPIWHHFEARKRTTEAVVLRTRSVDAICDELACTPDLVKIDVEGFELYVLRGARQLLSRQPVVYLEIHPQLTAKLGYDHTACFDLLIPMGYQITEVNGCVMTRAEFRRRHHTFFTVCR